MELLSLVLSVAFLQVWGAKNPLHQDGWFHGFVGYLSRWKLLAGSAWLAGFSIAVPVAAFLSVQYVLELYSVWLMLPVSIAVLLYAFGRGEFAEIIGEYTKACYIDDWASAVDRASSLGVDTNNLKEGDWLELHRHVLDEAGYRGFERMFAVFFWFIVLGPVGAVIYRLLFIFVNELSPQDDNARRVLWVLEWPAVRLLGMSFAITGNFVGCYSRWKELLLCSKRKTTEVLSPMILGALSVGEGTLQTGAVTRKELSLLHLLYRRTLWFWLAGAALFTLLL